MSDDLIVKKNAKEVSNFQINGYLWLATFSISIGLTAFVFISTGVSISFFSELQSDFASGNFA